MKPDRITQNRPILIVEDDEDLSVILANRLQAEGYKAATAMNWTDAEKIMDSDLPDLLIMDIHLPDANGMDVVEKLRKSERTKDLAIIVASASDKTEHLVRSIRSGVMFFIAKPFDLEELVVKVRSALFQRYEMDNAPER